MPDIGDAQVKSEGRRDELIFEQQLNEVCLLIDFVSGRSDRSLSNLKIRDPDTAQDLSAAEILQEISQMRFPDHSKPKATSRNSTLLLLAKDQLSALAQPREDLR
jgi:hypothetical protein